MDSSFISHSSEDDLDGFAEELAAIKATQNAPFDSDNFPRSPSSKKERVTSKKGNSLVPSSHFIDSQEKTTLQAEVDSLVKQVEHFRNERDKAVRNLQDMHTKDKKQIEHLTAAMKKVSNEAIVSKKQLWTKDREMAFLINKFNSSEAENKRMKQTLGGNKRANFGANNNNNNDSSQINADLYTHREMQELRASLDACRVDITEQRKKTMNSDAKAKVAESKCHELETRTLRAEQITEATEKLLIDTEKKSAEHIGKLYDNIRVLRNGLVELNGELASQASKGQFELSEIERERRLVSIKLDKLMSENAHLLEHAVHKDVSLANQSSVLGSLSAHVHQAPASSPTRNEHRLNEYHNFRTGHANSGDLSPTAKNGLIQPFMESEREHEAVAHLRLANKKVHELRGELKKCKEELEANKLKVSTVTMHTNGGHGARYNHKGSSNETKSHSGDSNLIEQMKKDFARETEITSSQLEKMRGTLEFLQTENKKLYKKLDCKDRNINDDEGVMTPTVTSSNYNSTNREENLTQDLAIAQLQVKALRANLVSVHKEVGKLKSQLKSKYHTALTESNGNNYGYTHSTSPDGNGNGRYRTNSVASGQYYNDMSRDPAYDNINNIDILGNSGLENKIMLVALNDAINDDNRDQKYNNMKRGLNEARRQITLLEHKLVKSEYRYDTINKMLQDIPSTLQVAQAEKRVLENKLIKMNETHLFAITTIKSDTQKEINNLHQLLDVETNEKRQLAKQLQKNGELVENLNERMEQQRKSSFNTDNVNNKFQSFVESFHQSPSYSFAADNSNVNGRQQYQYNPTSTSTSTGVPVESISSPQKGLSMSSSSFVAPSSMKPNPNLTTSGYPFSVPAYDQAGSSNVNSNQQNYDRLQQMMLNI
jgi:hypothetical protein